MTDLCKNVPIYVKIVPIYVRIGSLITYFLSFKESFRNDKIRAKGNSLKLPSCFLWNDLFLKCYFLLLKFSLHTLGKKTLCKADILRTKGSEM